MAQSGFTPILIYGSGTTGNQPSAGNLTNSANGSEIAINYFDGKLFYKDASNAVQTIASKSAAAGSFVNLSASGTVTFSSTGAVQLPSGTTGEQPTPTTGMLRFNTTTSQFEGYNGSAWGSIGGGATITNDTTTATAVYPLFAAATSGSVSTVYTGNTKLLYTPSTGTFQATSMVSNGGIFMNNLTLAASISIASGYSGMVAGPFSIPSGMTVTVASGSKFVVL